MGSVRSDGCDLYFEEEGEGAPALLIHPAGATASTWARDRGARPDRTSHWLGPPRIRPIRRRTGALDLHAYGRRRSDSGVVANPARRRGRYERRGDDRET
jgi:hypothetical protein